MTSGPHGIRNGVRAPRHRGFWLFAGLFLTVSFASAQTGTGLSFNPAPAVPMVLIQSFWMSWWFPVTVILAAVVFVVLMVVVRERSQQARLHNLEQLILERTHDLEQVVTQLEQAKASEIETQQLKTLNQLTATIAQEFNNPLGIIRGFCDLTQIEHSTDQKLLERMERVGLQVERIHSLVRKLMRLRTLREMDYSTGLKILDLHNGSTYPEEPPTPSDEETNLKHPPAGN